MKPGHVGVGGPARPLRRLAFTVATVASLCAAHAASGHALFMTYIQHRTTVTVGPANIDVKIELTFFESRSMTERRRMDADHDDAITATEVRAYLARIAPSLESAVRLNVGERPVDLVPLYDPEIDLLEVNEVAPCHHVLRLFYFARTPEWLGPGSEITIEDHLWLNAAAICLLETRGDGEVRVTSAQDAEPKSTANAGGPYVMRAKCLAVAGDTKQARRGRAAVPERAGVLPYAAAGAALVLVGIGGVYRRRLVTIGGLLRCVSNCGK